MQTSGETGTPPEQTDEFRQSAIELCLINLPSVGVGIYSEQALGHSAQVSASTVMEASDAVFSLGVFVTEKLDRLGKNIAALRTRQAFALGHIATAAMGVYFGVCDIANNNVPKPGNMAVAGTVASASAISLWRDNIREKRRATPTVGRNEPSTNSEVFHGLNAEFVKDMKRTNIAEAGGGLLAVLAQQYWENGSASLTIAGSLAVAYIMARNLVNQQKTYKSMA